MFTSWGFVRPGRAPVTPLDQDYDLISDTTSIYGIESVADTVAFDETASVNESCQSIETQHDNHCDCWVCSNIPWDELSGRPLAELTELGHEFEHCSITPHAANAIHGAGRPDAGQAFKDVRSSDKARLRTRSQNHKYYNFTAVPRGVVENHQDMAMVAEKLTGGFAEPVPLTKRAVFKEAQNWPRPPTRHRRARWKDRWPTDARAQLRIIEKKHCTATMQLEQIDELSEYDIRQIRRKAREDEPHPEWFYDALTDAEFKALPLEAFVDVVPG